MSIFANGTVVGISFVVQNITSAPTKIITIFNTSLYPGRTIDLMKIPGIAEEDIRASLIKGALKNKILNKELKVIISPEISSSLLGNDLLNILGPGNLIRPFPVVPAITKTLLNNTAATLFQVDLSQTFHYGEQILPDLSFGCKLFFAVECTDGYDIQLREGDVNAAAVIKNNIITSSQAVSATNAITGGTLLVTFDWSSNNSIAIFRVTATSSLISTDFKIHYFLLHATHRTPAFSFL